MKILSRGAVLTYGIAAALGCMALAGAANAAVVDFEDIAVGAGANTIGGDRVSGGFNFDSSTNHTHLGNDTSVASNGTTYLAVDDYNGAATITMSLVGGGTFGLTSFDIAEWALSADWASEVRLTGNLFGGGSIVTTVSLDGIADGIGGNADFETVVLGWSGLTSVVFDAVNGSGDLYYALDNISTEVPEAASLGLFGLGLVGLGLAARRRR